MFEAHQGYLWDLRSALWWLPCYAGWLATGFGYLAADFCINSRIRRYRPFFFAAPGQTRALMFDCTYLIPRASPSWHDTHTPFGWNEISSQQTISISLLSYHLWVRIRKTGLGILSRPFFFSSRNHLLLPLSPTLTGSVYLYVNISYLRSSFCWYIAFASCEEGLERTERGGSDGP